MSDTRELRGFKTSKYINCQKQFPKIPKFYRFYTKSFTIRVYKQKLGNHDITNNLKIVKTQSLLVGSHIYLLSHLWIQLTGIQLYNL